MKVRMAAKLLQSNAVIAGQNRDIFKEKGILAVNLISSPGSGKTSILVRTIKDMKDEVSIGVVEGDIQTTRDAELIEGQGVPVVQINTAGGCHLDAGMVRDALEDIPLDRIKLLFIENVGNLVCPAEFDLGESAKVVVLSVTEGADKPAKYPLVFSESKAMLLNKIDLLPFVDFDLGAVKRDATALNPEVSIFEVSATRGDGMEAWYGWLRQRIREASGSGSAARDV